MSDISVIGIVVFDGVEELDFVGPWEVLKLAEAAGSAAGVRLYAVGESLAVTAAHGMRFQADARLGTERLDVVIVPGGGWNDRGPTGTWAEVQRGQLTEIIVDVHQQGALVASVCTGAMVLASAGLLKGRHASSHRTGVAVLASHDAHYVDARVADEGDIITSGGVVAGIDLALWLVERHFGVDILARVEAEIEYTRRGPVWETSPQSCRPPSGNCRRDRDVTPHRHRSTPRTIPYPKA
jgi:transcriptional regulator GlxA family with amidase domain